MLRRRLEPIAWGVILLALLVWRWPLLMGWYHKAAGSPPPPSTIAWRADFDAALAEAQRTGRPVLVDVMADWCPPCIAMQHEVWPDDRVERLVAERYIPLQVDADTDTHVQARYGVRAIPTLLVIDARGTVLRRATYLPTSGMLRFLQDDEQ